MKKLLLLSIALSVSVLSLLSFAVSGTYAQKAPKTGNAPVTESYFVVKVTDPNSADNKVDYKVVASSQYKDEEKRIKDDYTQKVKEWKDLKKADPTLPMPVKPTIKKIGTTYQTQTGAQKIADKLKAEETNKDEQKPKDRRK